MPNLIHRDYQVRADAALKAAFKAKKEALLVAPCAAGKTIILSGLTQWLHKFNRRTLVLMDRHQLVEQNVEKLSRYIPSSDIGVACASSGMRQLSPQVIVGSRQTLCGLLERRPAEIFHLLIIDEVHLAPSTKNEGQYWKIIDLLRKRNPDLRILGCTATPYRLLSGRIYGPDKLFSQVDFHITAAELLAGGYIVPLTWRVRQSDLLAQLDAVRKSSTGDLNETEQAAVLGQARFIEGVFDVWSEQCRDKKTAIYALNIAHAESIAAVFASRDVAVEIIHSKLSTSEVKKRIARFAARKGVIINCSILAIGSDIPSITAIILARRTLSTALFFQIVGRGARIHPGKTECLVIDLCGGAMIHGIDPDNPILQVRGDEPAEPPIKICPMCETVVSITCRVCKCGFEFPVAEPAKAEPARETEAPGKLVNFKGFTSSPCDHTRYREHVTKRGVHLVMVHHFCRGKHVATQYLSPGWQHGKSQRDKAIQYWFELGGQKPAPINAREWMDRLGELSQKMELTLDESLDRPLVKAVRAA